MLEFRRLDRQTCMSNLAHLLDVHSDVSDWGAENFLYDLPSKWDLSLMGVVDRPVCYAILSRKWEDRVHIHQFMVHRDFRDAGVGSALIEEVKRLVFQSGDQLSLKVQKDNVRAISFYERHGFGVETCEESQLWMTASRQDR